jgi:hypothetical protein
MECDLEGYILDNNVNQLYCLTNVITGKEICSLGKPAIKKRPIKQWTIYIFIQIIKLPEQKWCRQAGID